MLALLFWSHWGNPAMANIRRQHIRRPQRWEYFSEFSTEKFIVGCLTTSRSPCHHGA
jgi:hypothetical protein